MSVTHERENKQKYIVFKAYLVFFFKHNSRLQYLTNGRAIPFVTTRWRNVPRYPWTWLVKTGQEQCINCISVQMLNISLLRHGPLCWIWCCFKCLRLIRFTVKHLRRLWIVYMFFLWMTIKIRHFFIGLNGTRRLPCFLWHPSKKLWLVVSMWLDYYSSCPHRAIKPPLLK